MRAQGNLAVAIGWNTEAFARTKTMKMLAEYLKPAPTPEGQRERDARQVKQMFDRMIAKQGRGQA